MSFDIRDMKEVCFWERAIVTKRRIVDFGFEFKKNENMEKFEPWERKLLFELADLEATKWGIDHAVLRS